MVSLTSSESARVLLVGQATSHPPTAPYVSDGYTNLLLPMEHSHFIDVEVMSGETVGTRVQYTDTTGGSVTSFSFYVTNYTAGDKIVLSLYDDSAGVHRIIGSGIVQLAGTDRRQQAGHTILNRLAPRIILGMAPRRIMRITGSCGK